MRAVGNALTRLGSAIAAVFSFRVALALISSVTVTTAVSAPLAYTAAEVRADLAVGTAGPDPEISQPAPVPEGSESPPVTDPETGEVVGTPTSTSPTTPASSPAATGPPTTRPPGIVADGLTVSLDAARQEDFPLDGYRLFGRLYVFLDVDGVTSVSYWIDETAAVGPADRTADAAPFDLGDPIFDTAALADGTHSLYARAITAEGVIERYAVFEVVNS